MDHFPALYHRHHNRNLEDLPYWSGLAQAHGDPILELGCGTGRVLVHLTLDGYQTFGLDNSSSMLSYLQKNLPLEVELLPLLFQADMSSLHLAIRFPLILMPCNTLSTLMDSARKKTIENVARHLEKGGCFSFSIPNPALLTMLPARGESEVEEIFNHPMDGEPVQVSSAWEKTSGKFILRWHYDHLLPNGKVDRHTIQVSHWIVPIHIYIEEIQATGMKIDKVYGDFDRSPYTNQSPNLIIRAVLPLEI